MFCLKLGDTNKAVSCFNDYFMSYIIKMLDSTNPWLLVLTLS